ncbi:hypothetical protein [Olivibacter domesticus]|uniref:Uncharacterized protein n=1 Tax=Olivibacter domesticus TaxID=407022 RepID=A0A1H7KEU4_OLID1|nr:hypothetical protein [Olivibacter domesticus]SEK85393.1 hypothetical protein SAMN05661044_01329 [Olivibacter domesticus]
MDYITIKDNQDFYEVVLKTSKGELVKLLVNKEEDTIQVVREHDQLMEALQINESSLEIIIR